MGRLVIPSHPNRVFKDEWWDAGDWPSAYGYRSIGDVGDEPTRYGDLWAFAVPLHDDDDPEEGDDHNVEMFERIASLQEPFVAAEIVRLGDGQLCAIGFYPEPSESPQT